MTHEKFTKYAYRHSELMILHDRKEDIEMLLLAVDFDRGVFRLAPFWTDYYEDEEIWVSYEYVDKPKRKPKMKVTINEILL